jgi:hypothetical protein
MRMTWPIFFFFYYIYRCCYSVFAELVVARLTPLGDTPAYHSGQIQLNLTNSNAITESLGGIFRLVVGGSPILIDICYQTLAFVGIYKLLMAVEPVIRRRLAIFLLLPSFNLWSSVASKESVIVLLMCIICSYIVDLYYNRGKLNILHIISIYLLYVYKPHYMAAIVFILYVSVLAKNIKQKAFFVILSGSISLIPLYIYKDRINQLSMAITEHFVGFGGSSRDAYWIDTYDIFWKAPYGMFQAFFGPTVSEAASGILHMASFIESTIIFSLLFMFLARELPRLPVYLFTLGVFTLFWILFTNYPLGILNPGSAIRYRTGYEILVFVVMAFLMSPNLFVTWRAGVTRGVGGAPRRELVTTESSS